MAGLLDFLQSPDAQLGIGLLAAGGPTTDPNQTGFGQRLSAGMQSMRASQMAQAQLAEMQQKAALQSVLLQNELNWQNMTGFGQPPRAPQGSGVPLSAPLSGGAPVSGGGAPVSAPSGAPASVDAAPQPGGGFRFPYVLPGKTPEESAAIAASQGRQAFMKLYAEQTAPQTDAQKLAIAAGYQPGTPEYNRAIKDALFKGSYVAPVNARPGSILRDPVTQQPIAFNPHIPDGWAPVYDESGNVAALKQIPNSSEAIASVEAAKKQGLNQQTSKVGYTPNGGSTFMTEAQAIDAANGKLPAPMRNNNPGALMPGGKLAQYATPEEGIAALDQNLQRYASQGINTVSGIVSKWAPPTENNTQAYINNVSTMMGVKPDQPLNMSSPVVRHMIAAGIMKQENGSGAFVAGAAPQQPQITPLPPPGAVRGQELNQDTLDQKGKDLAASNAQVNTVISRLQNIKMLAPGAIAGGETSRRDYFNSLLALAGMKGAEDAKTASDLVDKNASQIVSALRMGQGGAGTDALQTLLGAANPNRHMTKEAIAEAADQLIASQKMVQAKNSVLNPLYLNRNPVEYGQKENVFDQNADPRIWQLESLQPADQAKYVKSLPPEVASDLLQKRKALKQIGAL